MLKVRLVTDSTCDLPPDLVLRYGILVVPAVLNMEGKSYRDGANAEVASVRLPAQLSPMFNPARRGAEASGARVTLVDSGNVSMALGWQVLAAAEAVAAGKPLAEGVAAVE